MTKVSILTPAHRAQRFIARAARSVIQQTYTDWELLIVSDDGSDYRTLLASHGLTDPRIRFFTSPHPGSGPNAARNVALKQSKGDLIAPLDADDLYYPERLEKLVPLATEHGLCGDNLKVVDDHTGTVLSTPFNVSNTVRRLSSDEYIRLSVPIIFVFQRDVITAPWDEDVIFGADTLFNLRGMEMAHSVLLTEEVLHEYRIVEGSICHSDDSHERAERAYSYTLDKLEETGLHFNTKDYVDKVRSMLLHKRAVNRRYAAACKAGLCRSFEEFLALGAKSDSVEVAS